MKAFRGKNGWFACYIGATIIVLAATLVVWLLYERENRVFLLEQQRSSVQSQLDEVTREIETAIATQTAALESLATFVSLEPDLSKEKFEAVSRRTFLKAREFKHVALAPDFVVSMAYPSERTRSIIGLDHNKIPEQLAAVEKAVSSGAVVMAGPVDLVQGGRALIVRKAVQTSDFGAFAPRLWGIVSLALDFEAILERAGVDDLDFKIAMRGKDGLGMSGGMIFGEPLVFTQSPILQKINLPEGSWYTAAVPVTGWTIPQAAFLKARIGFALGGISLLILVLGAIRLVHLRMRSDAQLKTAMNSIADGFAYYDSSDRLALCNDNYRKLYAASAKAMVPGAKFESIVRYGLERQQYAEAIGREEAFLKERLAAHKAGGVDVEQQLADGRWLKILETKTPDGGTVGFRVDITELKNARDAAEAANTAKSEFLDVMSHELRTPLTVVLGGTPFLCKPEMLPTATKLFNSLEARGESAADLKAEVDALLHALKTLASKVDRSAKHLLTLINDVLDYSKIEAGRMQMNVKPLSLAATVEDLVNEYSSKAEKKGLYLEGEAPDIYVEADQIRLRQVFTNILDNALKFTEQGGVTISVDDRGAQVKVSVSDTGVGIPEDRLPEVFDKFSQVDSSASRKVGGTGLGMAITKQIIKLHGGEISVSSKLGEGTEFTFTLTRALADVEEVPMEDPAAASA
ncbi:MAG: ATP-binding protein [Pseudomonadota bacterium]|nr:ATP-binding protein [Pseudomonadota bacterium]